MATTAEQPDAAPDSPRTIGATAGDRRSVDERIMVVDPQLYVFCGGKGLKALQTMATAMARARVRFGDVIEIPRQKRRKQPMAIYLDADLTATDEARSVQAAADDAEALERAQKTALLRDLEGMGVKIVDLHRQKRAELLTAMRLDDRVTPGMPLAENMEGAQADPRIGVTKWVVNRGRHDDKNVVDVAREIVTDLQQADKPALGPEFWLTFVGSLDGGTGPVALPIMADMRAAIGEALTGSDTRLRTVAFRITSEPAAIDRERSHDGMQRKRDLNTAVQMILLLAADRQQGVEITPGEFVRGIPSEFTFIVGGRNGAGRTVPTDGGHYVPSRIVGKSLLARVFGVDYSKTGRAQAGFDRVDEGKTGVDAPVVPGQVFCALGLSEYVPSPDRAELTAAKRRLLLTQAAGLDAESSRGVEIAQAVEGLFPRDQLSLLMGKVKPPALNVRQFGEEEAPIETAEGVVGEFLRTCDVQLPTNAIKELVIARDDLIKRLTGTAVNLRFQYGLVTALNFLQSASQQVTNLDRTAQALMVTECSDAARTGLRAATTEDLANVTGTKVLFGLGLDRLQRRVGRLVGTANNYGTVMRDYTYLQHLGPELLRHMRDKIGELQRMLDEELRIGRAVLDRIEPDPQERATETPFDVPVPVELEVRDDPLLLRRDHLGNGRWTRDKYNAILRNTHVATDDINLVGRLTPERVAAADRNARVLLSLQTTTGEQPFINHTATATVPVLEEDKDTVPVPPKYTREATGPKGPALVVREEYGIDALLDNPYIFRCLQLLLETPPTLRQARRLLELSPGNPVARGGLNREAQFTWKGHAERYLPQVFLAVARRQMQIAGQKGDIVEQCPGEDCKVPFYRSEAEGKEGVTHCPACRLINPKTPVARVAQ